MFRTLLLIILLFSNTAFAGSGNLIRANSTNPSLVGFELSYQDDMKVNRQKLLSGQPIKLQSRFIWQGTGNINTHQHSIVAFTQTLSQDAHPVGTTRRKIWTHGVGALVGEFGLGIELWFRDRNRYGSYEGGTTDAYVWSQASNGCMRQVSRVIAPNILCLPSQYNKLVS